MNANPADTGAASEKTAHGCFVCETALPLLEQCLGKDTISHFRSARIEFLKGMRSLLDERIAQLSSQAESKGTHVTVE
jgi:hypothetical protein